jgi:hypothetical protein
MCEMDAIDLLQMKWLTYKKGLETILIVIVEGVGNSDSLQKHILSGGQSIAVDFKSDWENQR